MDGLDRNATSGSASAVAVPPGIHAGELRRPPSRAGYPTLGANRATPASLCPAVIAGWQVRVLRWRLPADCLQPRRAVRAALDRPLLRPFPSSSRVLLVIPSLAVRSGRRGRFHSLRGASIRRREAWRVPVLWVEAMEAGAVTRVSVSRHAVMRTCLGSGDRTRRSRAGCRPRWPRPRRAAPTTTAAIQVSSYKTTAVRVVHQTDGQGYGPTGAKGARSTSRPATRSTTPRTTKPRTSTGLRDTYPVYHAGRPIAARSTSRRRPWVAACEAPRNTRDKSEEFQRAELAASYATLNRMIAIWPPACRRRRRAIRPRPSVGRPSSRSRTGWRRRDSVVDLRRQVRASRDITSVEMAYEADRDTTQRELRQERDAQRPQEQHAQHVQKPTQLGGDPEVGTPVARPAAGGQTQTQQRRSAWRRRPPRSPSSDRAGS